MKNVRYRERSASILLVPSVAQKEPLQLNVGAKYSPGDACKPVTGNPSYIIIEGSVLSRLQVE